MRLIFKAINKEKQYMTMRNMILLLLLLSVAGCQSATDESIERTLKMAGENRPELERVLDYYKQDKQKLEAARFLVAHMAGHFSVESEALKCFQDKIHHYADTLPLWMPVVNRLWKEACEEQNHIPTKSADAEALSEEFLRTNIEQAFQAWQESAWREEVSFDAFCQYILPYRAKDEMLPSAAGWRDSLRREYYPLIAGEKDMRKAFVRLRDRVWEQVGSGSTDVPNIINVLDLKRQRKTNCIQCSVLFCQVLRAVGIPAAIDGVVRWANISRTGHSWVALVRSDGTYTVQDEDSVARMHEPLDASSYNTLPRALQDYPVEGLFHKTYANIVRSHYAPLPEMSHLDWGWELLSAYMNPFSVSVSGDYRTTGTLEVDVPSAARNAYLCIFATGKGWIPVAYARVKNRKACFQDMGEGVIYLPVVYQGSDACAVEPPFLWQDGEKKTYKPDTLRRQTVTLARKYPLTGSFLNRWTRYMGGRFEGSLYKDFHLCDTLYTIAATPGFRREVTVDTPNRYRYVRFVAPEQCNVPLTEVECYAGKRKLKGTAFGEGIKEVKRAFDGDTFTSVGKSEGCYVVGIDFGQPEELTKIVYTPENDGNYIIPDNEYELFYFDGRWVSLGRQHTDTHTLTYDNVPAEAVLWLRNLTKGVEERIFIYKEGRQVWY